MSHINEYQAAASRNILVKRQFFSTLSFLLKSSSWMWKDIRFYRFSHRIAQRDLNEAQEESRKLK